jgi:hypothetical protein
MPPDCLTLFVPELLRTGLEDRQASGRPAGAELAALLARGRLAGRAPRAPEAVLAEMFGQVADVSLGEIRRRGESGLPDDAGSARCIAADPVHLSVEREHFFLVDGAALAVTPEETAAVVDALNRYFVDLGVFHAAGGERWYLRPAAGRGERVWAALARRGAPPLFAVAGGSVEQVLREIIEDREIRHLYNEIQTLLHAQPVNRRREESGRATINSLWLWGAGTPPAPPSTDFDGVWSGDPLARGLARSAGLPSYPLPEDAGALLVQASSCRRPLAVLEEWAGPVRCGSEADYEKFLAVLEARWFAPAWRALALGAVRRLRLVAPCRFATLDWEAGRAAAWSFWRRPRRLAETVAALAAAIGEGEEETT